MFSPSSCWTIPGKLLSLITEIYLIRRYWLQSLKIIFDVRSIDDLKDKINQNSPNHGVACKMPLSLSSWTTQEFLYRVETWLFVGGSGRLKSVSRYQTDDRRRLTEGRSIKGKTCRLTLFFFELTVDLRSEFLKQWMIKNQLNAA